MSNAEMQRRLATLSPTLLAEVRQMIAEGYGGHGIACESTATVKQINAVFQLVANERKAAR